MPVEDKVKIKPHIHELTKRNYNRSYESKCDGSQESAFDECFQGIEKATFTQDQECWSCEPCGYDYCLKCMQVFMYLEKRHPPIQKTRVESIYLNLDEKGKLQNTN